MDAYYTEEEIGERGIYMRHSEEAVITMIGQFQAILSDEDDPALISEYRTLCERIVRIWAEVLDDKSPGLYVHDDMISIVNFIGTCDDLIICNELLVMSLVSIFETLLVHDISTGILTHPAGVESTTYIHVTSFEDVITTHAGSRTTFTDIVNDGMCCLRDTLSTLIDEINNDMNIKKERLYERTCIIDDIIGDNANMITALHEVGESILHQQYMTVFDKEQYSWMTRDPTVSDMHRSLIPADCINELVNAENITQLEVMCNWCVLEHHVSGHTERIQMTPYMHGDDIVNNMMTVVFVDNDATVTIDPQGVSFADERAAGEIYSKAASVLFAKAIETYERMANDITDSNQILVTNYKAMLTMFHAGGSADDLMIVHLREDISALKIRNSMLSEMRDWTVMIVEDFARKKRHHEAHPLIPIDMHAIRTRMSSVITDDEIGGEMRDIAIALTDDIQDRML